MTERGSIVRRMYETVACYWVLLVAHTRESKKSGRSRPARGRDGKVEHCLKLQKGTRFQLSGGTIRLANSREGEDEARSVPSVTPVR